MNSNTARVRTGMRRVMLWRETDKQTKREREIERERAGERQEREEGKEGRVRETVKIKRQRLKMTRYRKKSSMTKYNLRQKHYTSDLNCSINFRKILICNFWFCAPPMSSGYGISELNWRGILMEVSVELANAQQSPDLRLTESGSLPTPQCIQHCQTRVGTGNGDLA